MFYEVVDVPEANDILRYLYLKPHKYLMAIPALGKIRVLKDSYQFEVDFITVRQQVYGKETIIYKKEDEDDVSVIRDIGESKNGKVDKGTDKSKKRRVSKKTGTVEKESE